MREKYSVDHRTSPTVNNQDSKTFTDETHLSSSLAPVDNASKALELKTAKKKTSKKIDAETILKPQ